MLRASSARKAQVAVIPKTITCDEHGEKVNLFCENCNNLVCSDCIVDKHNGHTFKRVNEIVSEKRKELTQKLDQLKTKTVPEIRRVLDKTRQRKSQQQQNGRDLTDWINSRADELVSDVNKARKEVLQEIETCQKEDQDKLDKHEQSLEEILNETESTIVQYTDLTTSEAARIIKIGLELDTQESVIGKEIYEIPIVNRRVILPGKVVSFRDVLGRCVQEENTINGTKLEVLSQFQLKNKSEIRSIAITDSNSAWVATFRATDLRLLTKAGTVGKTIKLPVNIIDLAIMEDGSLLVVNNGRPNVINRVNSNGDITKFIDLLPLKPVCVSISSSGHIYIGIVDSFKYELNNNSNRSVMKLSMDGTKLKTWQLDERGERIFTRPKKIRININGDIWVLDRTGHIIGRIVVLDSQEDQVKVIYNGVKNNKTTNSFNPCDLTVVSDGKMLVGDRNNHVVHVLDENGVLLQLIDSQYLSGLGRISSLCFNCKENELWVGTHDGHVQVLRFTSVENEQINTLQ